MFKWIFGLGMKVLQNLVPDAETEENTAQFNAPQSQILPLCGLGSREE